MLPEAMINSCLQSFQIIKRRGATSLSLVSFFNPAFSYAVRIPKSWTKTELQDGSVVKFEFTEDGKPVITFLVTVKPVGDLDLANDYVTRYTTLLQEQVLETSTLKALPKIAPATLGGYPANKTTFFSDSLQVTGRYNMVWTVQNKHVGIITFVHTITEDDPDQELYSVMFERIVESFRFVSGKEQLDPNIRYENIPQKFAIHYPPNYLQQEGFMGSTVSFSHVENNTEFPTNLNVVVQDMGSQPMTLEEFCDMLKQQLEYSVRDSAMLSDRPKTIAGAVGREFVYTGKIDTDASVKFLQRVVVKDGKAAVINFTGDKYRFDRDFAACEACLDSFCFL